eukprot:TRINITY_DN3311_c0_g1_i1.p1 TRINITY_DN3311_c0_g1~~TRINITY_DN3311_c0_g1_i1.p1  ORF type:complete len:297 (-),score=128.62 TRINITY_DN3311_c0_g1_i1:41-931(-)
MSNQSSDLFELINFFSLGNYQAAINEGLSLGSNSLRENDVLMRDFYVYQSYIALGNYSLVQSEIKENALPSLQIVKLMATFMAKEESRENIANGLKEWMKDGNRASDPFQQYVAATIFIHQESFQDAMRCVFQSTNVENLALLVQIYLKINRITEAKKELKRMQSIDDDHSLTQLCDAWIALAEGGERVDDAIQTFKVLGDRYGATATLLNGLGTASLKLKKFSEAEQYFLQALEKRPNDTDALVNLITAQNHLAKPAEIVQRQFNQLASIAPKHPWILRNQELESEFDRLQGQFA